jgi:hypothetical protein
VEYIVIYSVYPEGGDLIGDLLNRVYIGALLPSREPADVVGNVCESNGGGACVAAVQTLHEGRGVSTVFVPRVGQVSVTRRNHFQPFITVSLQ